MKVKINLMLSVEIINKENVINKIKFFEEYNIIEEQKKAAVKLIDDYKVDFTEEN